MRKKIISFVVFCFFTGIFFFTTDKKQERQVRKKEKEAKVIEKKMISRDEVTKKKSPDRLPAQDKNEPVTDLYPTKYGPLNEQIQRFKFKPEDLYKVNGEKILFKDIYKVVMSGDEIPSGSTSLDEGYISGLGFQLIKASENSTHNYGTQYMIVRESSGRRAVMSGDLMIEYLEKEAAIDYLSGFESLRYKDKQSINPVMPFMLYQVNNIPENLNICSEILKSRAIKNCNFEIISGRVSSN